MANQKDYKEIAGIIKENMIKVSLNKDVIRVEVINDLANYFEREKMKIKDNLDEKSFLKYNEPRFEKTQTFNREQFLKDCGVKE